VLLDSQKKADDKHGLGYEKGESLDLVKEILNQGIGETNLEDLRSNSLMLKGIHPSMEIISIAINLVIDLLSVEVE